MAKRAIKTEIEAAVTRLNALSPLDHAAKAALASAIRQPRTFRRRSELLVEGRKITETLIILSGWAARIRLLEDGRRQVISLLLPGDLIGYCDQERPVASSSVIALTPVSACIAPAASRSAALARAYGQSRALEEAHLQSQIVRLGRLNAQERIADLLLEILERLELTGLATNGRYMIPLTQETMADALGLTTVHINRTLQALRREGSLIWTGREVVLPNASTLRRTTGRSLIRVSAV